MDKAPTQSLPKRVLAATPLFMIIMAILTASNYLTYLFVLDFVENVAGTADLLFVPTLQYETTFYQAQATAKALHTDKDNRSLKNLNYSSRAAWILDDSPSKQSQRNLPLPNNIFPNGTFPNVTLQNRTAPDDISVPLVEIKKVYEWAAKHSIIKGFSARWLIPVKAQNTDALLLSVDLEKYVKLGFARKSNITALTRGMVSVSTEYAARTGVKKGESVMIELSISNLLEGRKLIYKYRQQSSSYAEYTQNYEFNARSFYKAIARRFGSRIPISERQFVYIYDELAKTRFYSNLKVDSIHSPNGLYASALHNVIVVSIETLEDLLAYYFFVYLNKVAVQDIPISLSFQWITFKALFLNLNNIRSEVGSKLREYSIFVGVILNYRELIYNPNRPLGREYNLMLYQCPGSLNIVSLYPIFKDSLEIRHFFRSVIQVFGFVTLLVYYYVMSLVIKSIYEQCYVEIGIWRALGAAFYSAPVPYELTITAYQAGLIPRLKTKINKYFIYTQSVMRGLSYTTSNVVTIINKIGFAKLWLLSTLISTVLVLCLKEVLISRICSLLGYAAISQEIKLPLLMGVGSGLLCQILCLENIQKIYYNPLASTIKPEKRTYNEVKIRLIKMATFGVSPSVMAVSLLIVYYGFVSSYWIPYSILTQYTDLQVVLFNSIFLTMILGLVILIAISQSPLERLCYWLLSHVSRLLFRVVTVADRSIQAKKYKNIKMTMIISSVFAFLLFFTSGIRVEIEIVKSVVERNLGAKMVLENYYAETFNTTWVNELLKTRPEVTYAWLSQSVNNKNIGLQFISHVSSEKNPYSDWKVLTDQYMNATLSNYYFPEEYEKTGAIQYTKTSEGQLNGFCGIYMCDGSTNQSVGHFDPQNTIVVEDPSHLKVGIKVNDPDAPEMAPSEQIINLVITQRLRKKLGIHAGALFRVRVSINTPYFRQNYDLRAKIVHVLKASPGIDFTRSEAYISAQQADYIRGLFKLVQGPLLYEKLFLNGPDEIVQELAQKIVANSPANTQLFDIRFVSSSFAMLEFYLVSYVSLVTSILGILILLFVFVYTAAKCKYYAHNFMILRAVGLEVKGIRVMIFVEVMLRILIAIINGILFGVIISFGFSSQVEEFLMINSPKIALNESIYLGLVMLSVSGITCVFATGFLKHRTVLRTAKP